MKKVKIFNACEMTAIIYEDYEKGFDLDKVKKYPSPGTLPLSAGGTNGRLWTTDINSSIYEHNPDTMEVIKTHYIKWGPVWAIGGVNGRLFGIEKEGDMRSNAKKIYELNPDTMEIIASYKSPDTQIQSIGGLEGELFVVSYCDFRIYKLDIDTMEVIEMWKDTWNRKNKFCMINMKGYRSINE